MSHKELSAQQRIPTNEAIGMHEDAAWQHLQMMNFSHFGRLTHFTSVRPHIKGRSPLFPSHVRQHQTFHPRRLACSRSNHTPNNSTCYLPGISAIFESSSSRTPHHALGSFCLCGPFCKGPVSSRFTFPKRW